MRELRQNLSVYLARVKKGERLVVTEHRQVVAVLAPADATEHPLSRLIAAGRATARHAAHLGAAAADRVALEDAASSGASRTERRCRLTALPNATPTWTPRRS